ncbi:bis(5'-nucleosyl)-tetraphosphatase (symmetrical) YqeK [Halalkalibacter akibai]|uniref:bis(5'-nucleosyl)-tetraphosphatase (symmetrical) n=1 Tax=Halalkalibacter akibai (strain ATCC 43226 / DSM 21942 / CIP 109018 / JCM 9157 / 1139) TaxID=1236973 RepID=W4QML8_HALA3|nr:bis(5'-nucleosyl)-tetraphosphatase (symmetrical) YqeK [Halalkalibacter akibai]GAE33336.1 hydrolase [Halalkalibacter akibai JCM 9157]
MNLEQALEKVRPHLTDHRYQHTLGVIKAAEELAERFDADKDKAIIASVFHDYAKFRDKEEMKRLVREKLNDKSILDYGDELLHAPCGAYYVENEVGIKDQEILDAIRYHTTGKPHMTVLEKVVFLADYIEPGRHFKGIETVREIAEHDLDKAIIEALKNTMNFLMKQNQLVFPETIATYNQLINDKKEK